MIEIKVLGTGCPNCKTLYSKVQETILEMGIVVNLSKEEDILKIIGFNVIQLPGLVINGKVVSMGKVPEKEELIRLIEKELPNKEMSEQELKEMVKQRYGKLATQTDADSCCCSKPADPSVKTFTIMSEDYKQLDGYVPEADLGAGCGLPTQYARIRKGDTVIDLGSGAGNDCFVARAETGPEGQIIGVDFAPEMVARAKTNAEKNKFDNVRFIEADIEEIPLPDNFSDVVVSNCVLNLLPQKNKIFKEIYRLLKPGGHFCVSDVVLNGFFPKAFTDNAAMYAGCIASAIQREDYLAEITKAGFRNVKVERTKTIQIPDDVLHYHLSQETYNQYKSGNVGIYSITVTGEKP